jgi:hypothetical protein
MTVSPVAHDSVHIKPQFENAAHSMRQPKQHPVISTGSACSMLLEKDSGDSEYVGLTMIGVAGLPGACGTRRAVSQ